MNSDEDKNRLDRPLECNECKRPIQIHYTEIVGKECHRIGMCEVCPQLQKRLKKNLTNLPEDLDSKLTGLVCGECGTTLEAVRMGSPLGCSLCYTVFGDVLLQDLTSSKSVSQALGKKRKTVPLHIGRPPGEAQEISPTLQLIALHETLEETLAKEDYEQAAFLRDQIKALTEKTGEHENES